ncbi:hypothetical protein PSP6_270207 [Paraburkholderia tropica]|nr:hypothetical protein PSP6_270207 [Paraburkholderia tropica]
MGYAARHDPLYLCAMRGKCFNHRLSTPRIDTEIIFERLERDLTRDIATIDHDAKSQRSVHHARPDFVRKANDHEVILRARRYRLQFVRPLRKNVTGAQRKRVKAKHTRRDAPVERTYNAYSAHQHFPSEDDRQGPGPVYGSPTSRQVISPASRSGQ